MLELNNKNRAGRLVKRLLLEYSIELEEFIKYSKNEDTVADAANDLGYVLALVKSIEKDD